MGGATERIPISKSDLANLASKNIKKLRIAKTCDQMHLFAN